MVGVGSDREQRQQLLSHDLNAQHDNSGNENEDGIYPGSTRRQNDVVTTSL